MDYASGTNVEIDDAYFALFFNELFKNQFFKGISTFPQNICIVNFSPQKLTLEMVCHFFPDIFDKLDASAVYERDFRKKVSHRRGQMPATLLMLYSNLRKKTRVVIFLAKRVHFTLAYSSDRQREIGLNKESLAE